MNQLAFILCLAATVTSCVSRSVHSRVVTGQVAPFYAGEVRVRMQKEPLPPEYIEVALLEVVGDKGRQHLIDELKGEAARLGCNEVVSVTAENPVATGIAVRTPAAP